MLKTFAHGGKPDPQPAASNGEAPHPFKMGGGRVNKLRVLPDLGEFLKRELMPALRPEVVFTDPAHGFHKTEAKWQGGCPWHKSKSGTSFYLDPETLLWRCPACGFGGGPVQYRYRLGGGKGSPRGAEFVNVVRELAGLAGVEFPERELTEEEQEAARRREARCAALDDAAAYCERVLWSPAGEAARAYLRDRGLPDDALRDLRVGLYDAAARVKRALRERGHSDDDLSASAVLWKRLEGYITFPWNDDAGRLLTVYFKWPARRPPEGKVKTLALPNPKAGGKEWEATKRSPYLLDRALRAGHRELVLVEGVTDAAVAQAHGDGRVVACVAAELSQEQVKTFVRRGVRKVVVCLDPDQAGESGIASCVRQLHEAGVAAYVAAKLPDGLDPDDFIKAHGIDAWREHVGHGEHAYRHEAHRIIGTHRPADGWTDQAEDAAVGEAVAYAAGQPPNRADEFDRHFWPVVTEETGATAEALWAKVRAERSQSGGKETGLYEIDAEDLLSREAPDLEYLPLLGKAGYFVEGWSHLLAGFPRCGKTELMLACIRGWLRTGRPVLYFTEEGEALWRERLERRPGPWRGLQLVFAAGRDPGGLLARMKDSDQPVVVMDTLRNLGILGPDENDNASVARHLGPWIAAGQSGGKTTFGLHHNRKGGGDHGEGISGGHAIMSLFDVALEITRDSNHRRRVIKGQARIIEVKELLYEMDDKDELTVLGDPASVTVMEVRAKLLMALGDDWKKTADVRDLLDEPRPGIDVVREALTIEAKAGRFERNPAISQKSTTGKTFRWRAKPT